MADLEKGSVALSHTGEVDSGMGIHRVKTSGKNNEIVHLGDTAVQRDELVAALGLPFPTEQPVGGYRLGNAAPLGFATFGICAFVMGMYNLEVRGIVIPNIMIGLCFFSGGLSQTIVGICELLVGNTFGVIGFTAYGAFFFSYGTILTKSFGIAEAYGDDLQQLADATGIYLLSWAILSFVMFTVTLKTTYEICLMFFLIFLSFVFNAVAQFTGNTAVKKVAGVVLLLISTNGFYLAYCEFCKTVPEIFYFRPKMTPMPGAPRV